MNINHSLMIYMSLVMSAAPVTFCRSEMAFSCNFCLQKILTTLFPSKLNFLDIKLLRFDVCYGFFVD